jgi:serine protease
MSDIQERVIPTRPQFGFPNKTERPSGFVVVRLAPASRAAAAGKESKTLVNEAESRGLERLIEILRGAGSPETYRLVQSVPASKLQEMERQAAQTTFAPLHSLTQYWRIDVRKLAVDHVARLVMVLNELPEVETAYEEPLAILALVTPADDPYNVSQNYQDTAPTGIDARWMWLQSNGEGAGVGIVDIEGGWRVTHEDLAGKSPTLIHGVHFPSWEDHGTAVLGEIVAIDNVSGVVGGAPAISSVRMASIYNSSGIQDVTSAFAAAVAAMSTGQILLIELQTGSFLPMETVPSCLDSIRLATALGVIVVEAAGNGNSDLDVWSNSGGQQLNRASLNFVDSGAIMVGACVSAVPHERWQWSNYGSRIDCFAWGENVTTTGYGDLDNGGGNADRYYTNTFQGTSSASPIIVSAAALIQSRYQAASGTLLSPGQMRALLANPATGTPQGTTVAGTINVMPNLAMIVPTLGIVPDLYLRDAVGDVGIIPWTGALCTSPDIIVRDMPETNPQSAWGEGSGNENSAALSTDVEFGQDNFVYVRVRNRAAAAATNVTATVYWSPPSTLATPSLWNLIGSVIIPNVPAGDILTSSDAIIWQSASVPPVGHYCFIATLQHPNDPAPPTPGSMTWNDYVTLIRAHNNVTWRNFNVVNALPPAETPSVFAFQITAADDEPVLFGFEVERRLPPDARLELEGPLVLLNALRGDNQWTLTRSEERGKARLVLPSLPRIVLGDVRLRPGSRIPCTFRIRAGKHGVNYGHGVALRQLYKREEIGRIGWQWAPEPCFCRDKK